jgi:hypothetical protein
MRDYQYEFLDLNGRLEASLTLCAQSDGHASVLGSDILSGNECLTLEIRKDETLIFQVGRNAARERRV